VQIVTALIRLIERWRTRRHDKLKLWVGMLLAASVPILLCYGIPTWFAEQRARNETSATATAQTFEILFHAEYADLIAVCELTGQANSTGQIPGTPKVLAIQYGTRASIQNVLPDSWQPSSPEDVSVVVCLGRQHVEPVETCTDGTKPDLSALDEATTRRLMRYVIEITVYDLASGQAVRKDALWGDDPPICAGVDAQQEPEADANYGAKIAQEDILNRLIEIMKMP